MASATHDQVQAVSFQYLCLFLRYRNHNGMLDAKNPIYS